MCPLDKQSILWYNKITMNNFLGSKTRDQIEMVRAILILKNKNTKTFSARKISELCGIPSRNFAGAFMALANPCKGFFPLVLKAGREEITTTKGRRYYIQLWRVNPDFNWTALGEELKNF